MCIYNNIIDSSFLLSKQDMDKRDECYIFESAYIQQFTAKVKQYTALGEQYTTLLYKKHN